MKDHISQNQIEDYCRRKLSAVELLSVSDHLEGCAACRRQIEAASNGENVFFSLQTEIFGDVSEATHATAEQTAAYVDGALTDDALQTFNDHLHRCAECAHAVNDLQAFKDQIGDQIDVMYSPASTPRQSETRRRRFSFVPSFAVTYPTFTIAAALAVLIIALSGWLVWRTTRTEPITQDLAVSPPETSQEPHPGEAPIVAQLKDADGEVTLNQTGHISGVDRLPPEYQKIVKDALANQRIDASPALKELVRASSPLMSSDKDNVNFSVIEPAGKVLLTDRPSFRWNELKDASSYVVEIYDNQLNLIVASSPLTGHTWTTTKSLARGRIYSWQVKAIKDERTVVAPRPPAPQAKFRIVDSAEAGALAEARRAYSSSHLLLGMLYAKAGLLDDARQEFHELQKANPDSEIVRKLIASLTPPRRQP